MKLTSLTAGMPIIYGGDRYTTVPTALAADFRDGDQLVVVQTTGDLLHIPAAAQELVDGAVDRASAAFAALAHCTSEQIDRFFDVFAVRLADDAVFAAVAAANAAHVESARRAWACDGPVGVERQDARRHDRRAAGLARHRRRSLGRGRTGRARRLVCRATPRPARGRRLCVRRPPERLCRRGWGSANRQHRGASNRQRRAGTARAIMECALRPALDSAGLPPGAIELLHSPSRATGWALFGHRSLALAIARGSGKRSSSSVLLPARPGFRSACTEPVVRG